MKPPSTELFFYLLEIIPLKTNFKGGDENSLNLLVRMVVRGLLKEHYCKAFVKIPKVR